MTPTHSPERKVHWIDADCMVRPTRFRPFGRATSHGRRTQERCLWSLQHVSCCAKKSDLAVGTAERNFGAARVAPCANHARTASSQDASRGPPGPYRHAVAKWHNDAARACARTRGLTKVRRVSCPKLSRCLSTASGACRAMRVCSRGKVCAGCQTCASRSQRHVHTCVNHPR